MGTPPQSLKLYDIPAGTRPIACRGPSCGKLIYFVVPPGGTLTPIDVDIPGGKKPSESKDRSQADLFGVQVEVFDGRGVSHFHTCSDRELFTRKPKK